MTDVLTKIGGLQSELSLTLQALNLSVEKYNEEDTFFDIIVTSVEINERHGVGVLLKRIFRDTSKIISLRTTNLYDGTQEFGQKSYCLNARDRSYAEILLQIQSLFLDLQPRKVLVIPYYVEDFYIGLALKSLFQIPVCTYLMDDQNIYADNVEDKIVRSLIDISDLCLGISKPLCQAYKTKYGKQMWFLPPMVEGHLIATHLSVHNLMGRGVLIGNIWSQDWLEKLRQVCREAHVELDWYGNPNRQWLKFNENELEKDGIFFRGYCSQDDLIERLRQAPFAIVPTGSSTNNQDRPEFSLLSLPSRITFITATSNTPIIILGSEESAAAKFIRDFNIGVVCDYSPENLRNAVHYLQNGETQTRIRQNSLQLSLRLKADGLSDWIWQSLLVGKPVNNQFIHISQLEDKGSGFSVVITPNEVNQRHGTGALVKRIFPNDEDIISIRSQNHFQGEHKFGTASFHLDHSNISRPAIFQSILYTLEDHTISRLFCVPYFSSDILTAIAIKDIYNVPMATYLMDDQNIVVNKIPDDLMMEFLSKCTVRFATHPELRDIYENKYGLKFWLLPAVVPDHLINNIANIPSQIYSEKKVGALIGSIWSQKWFKSLCSCIQAAGINLDWFGNNEYYWLTESNLELKKWGIYPQGLYPEDELASKLKEYPFIVVPTGTLDERDDQPQLSKLSLPGRIIFNLATSNTPVILLGSNQTSAAKFINRFKIGAVCDYTPESLSRAVEYVLNPENQRVLRENAARVASQFTDRNIDEWVWQSLDKDQAADLRFESLLPRSPIDLVHFIEPPVPPVVYRDFVQVYQVMRRLKRQKYQPDFVVDVGASHGIWSHTASQIFPEALYILIDPLISKYEQSARNYYISNIPKVRLLEIAISNKAGKLNFQVSPDLYGSSILKPADFRQYETIEVDVKTLNQVAAEQKFSGRGVLKLDVQCAEHIVLEGGVEFLHQIDLVIAELSFVRYDENALIFNEMLNLLERYGFRYYDETGGWRSPIDGTLLQKEVVFIRQGLLVPELSREIAHGDDSNIVNK